MASNIVAFRVTGIDGSDLGLVEAVSKQYSDGVVTFYDKNSAEVASFNQDAVRGWVPVTETEAPELTPGAYTFEIEIGGETRKVVADEFVHETLHAGEEPLVVVVFRTKVGGNFRKELSINAADVKAIVRVEAKAAGAKGSVKKTA